jgi:hypothetical protein
MSFSMPRRFMAWRVRRAKFRPTLRARSLKRCLVVRERFFLRMLWMFWWTFRTFWIRLRRNLSITYFLFVREIWNFEILEFVRGKFVRGNWRMFYVWLDID